MACSHDFSIFARHFGSLAWSAGLPETLQYRFANDEEIPQLARLIGHSFPGPARPPGWWEEQLRHPRQGGGAETLFIGLDAGQPVAAMQLHRLQQWISGEALPVAGVGTVAISPTHRRRRLGADLVKISLHSARERGDLGAALYPFRTSFYQKLGFGHAGQALQFQVPPHVLPDSPERLRMERLETVGTQAEALACYNEWIRTQTGQMQRNEQVWGLLLEAQGRALFGYRAADGRLTGYALVTYRTDLPRPQRYLEVEELVWLDAATRRGLYAWLASLGDQWEQLLIRSLPSHQLAAWISDPWLPPDSAPRWGLWAPAATLLSGPMFRLLDVRAAWERRRTGDAEDIAIGIEVADEQIQENNGWWRLELSGGGVSVTRRGDVALTLRMNISTLSRLYIAALSPADAYTAGLLECERPELLARLGTALALPEPWTFDRF